MAAALTLLLVGLRVGETGGLPRLPADEAV